jgi:hypothetical protein
MSSIEKVHRQARAIVEKALKQRPPLAPDGPLFQLHLFLPDEQERLEAFLAPLPYDDQRKLYEFEELSSEEFEQYGYWLYLQQALKGGDTAAAGKLRRRLVTSRQALIEMFLSLDLSFLPTGRNDPGPSVAEDHCIYYLNRTGYRDLCINHIERGRITRDTVDHLWRWIEVAEAALC